MEEQKLVNLITKFKESETVKALHRYFSEKSMMEILGVDRDENTHSKFLGWLFSNSQTGPQAVNNLLNVIGEPSKDIKQIKVILEYHVKGEKKDGRADIVLLITYDDDELREKLRIVIENKVESNEHDNQTDTYFKYYNKQGGETIYFFLAPYPKNQEINEHFHWITYQVLMDKIIIPVFCSTSEQYKKIEDYIRSLSINYTQKTIMAVSPELKKWVNKLWIDNKQLWNYFRTLIPAETRNILIEFWNSKDEHLDINYKDIIQQSFKALYTITANSDNKDNQIVEVNDRINPSSKKDDKYKIGINGKELTKNGLVRCIVEQYICRRKGEVTLYELQEAFPYYLQAKTSSALNMAGDNEHQVIISSKQYKAIPLINPKTGEKYKKDPQKRWRELPIKNDVIYVHQDKWDGNYMMSRLIKHVNDNIPELQDLEIIEIPWFLQKT